MPTPGLFILFMVVSLAMTIGMGHWMAFVFSERRTWLTPYMEAVERTVFQWIGLPDAPCMLWQTYAKHFLLFNCFMGLLCFSILLFQQHLPLNPLHYVNMEAWQAFNTVCSFVTNTNWQSYSGEATLTNLTQMLAITLSMIIGSGTGISVGLAFLRGLTGRPLGNFYQDFLRSFLYVLLPIMVLGSLFFISQGVPQALTQQTVIQTVEGTTQKIALGPVASLLVIKQLGTNGGGFFNVNSAHPFENPSAITNFVEMMLELAIPMGFVYVFGVWLQNRRQAWLIWGAMMALFLCFLSMGLHFELAGNSILSRLSSVSLDTSAGNLEGKELRFGVVPSVLFTTVTTATSTGAVNNMHDSLTPLAGAVPMINMMLNIIFGGVGVGLMGFLLYGIISVFLTGLMVGRTPEIFGKKIEKPEIILASIAILLHPILILIPSAMAATTNLGVSSIHNAGPHGLSEIVYAYASAAANNGSAFSGLNANTPWYNISIGLVILLGRYISMISLLAIAGSLLRKPYTEPNVGTLRIDTVLFTAIWLGIIVIVGALTFVPVLVLGPLAEHLAMLQSQLF